MTRNQVTRRAVLRRAGAAGALAATGLATGATAAAQASESVAQVVAVAPDGEFRFEPGRFEITAGDTVRWEWKSGGHNVSPTVSALPAGAD